MSNSAELDPFVFVGGSLALDLVNTEVVVRGKSFDLLTSPADVAAWWRLADAHHPAAGLASELAFPASAANSFCDILCEFRGVLRTIFTAVTDGRSISARDLSRLNHVLEQSINRVAIDEEDRPRLELDSRGAGPDDFLVPIARSAAELLTGKDLARLHRCGNQRCVLLFYDTTRSATRRWCSTECMQRARSSRRYRERQRSDPHG